LVVGKIYRSIGRIVGYGAAILAALVAVICVRLMAGPIDLDFLRTRIAQEFDTAGGKIRVDAEHIAAEWGSLHEPMRLVFTGLRVTNEDKKTVASAPRVSLSFEPRSVLKAIFLPTAIMVDHPNFEADITREGGMLQRVLPDTDSSSQSEVVGLLIEQLLAKPNYTTLIGQLDTVRVEHAQMTLRDVPSGVTWVARDMQGRLKRDEGGVIISANGRFSDGGGPVGVSLTGRYARNHSRISLEARIDGLKPSMLAKLSPDIDFLRGVDIALSGRMRIEANGAGDINNVAVEVTGGAGTVSLPGILSASHKVRSLSAVASVDAASHMAKIDHVLVDLGETQMSITGVGRRTDQGQTFSGRAELKRIPVDHLADYWPLQFAPGGRVWALANLSHGTTDIAAEFGLSAPGDDISQVKVDRLVAFLDYDGMTVRYMPEMPSLAGVSGKAHFEGGTLHFDVAHGAGAGLTVSNATIDTDGLDDPNLQTATLHAPITGTAAAALGLLARPRLGLPKDVLYDPKRLGGRVAIDLSLSFPLLNSSTFADLGIRADATLQHFSLKGVLGDVDLAEATGHVVYSNAQLDVTGAGKLDGNPVDIVWRERFGPKAPYRQRYELKGTIPAELVARAGFSSPEPFLTGPINITSFSYQAAPNGAGELHGKFDLKGAKASVPQLAWGKEAGIENRLNMALKFASGGKIESAEFDDSGGGLVAKGVLRFGAGSALEQVTLGQLLLGRTDVAIDWRRVAGGADIDLRGRSIELARVRQALKVQDENTKATPAAAAKPREITRVAVHLNQVLAERGTLGGLNGRLEMSGDRIASADLALGAGKGSTFRVQAAAGTRNVTIYSADFGALLRDAGWLDGLASSNLDFHGHFDDTATGNPLVGTLKFGPYRLQKVTPRKDVGSLNSTIDGLGRAGNSLQQFDGLEAQITKVGDRVDVKNGRTSGKSIGLTTAGYLDLASDSAHLHGVVVPGFRINNLLSNVPLLGPLITGGKDAGIFAISYTLEGPFDDLKSDFNIMSAVTPGVLRDLFIGSSGGNAPPAPRDNRLP
jgi:hypothetical protein